MKENLTEGNIFKKLILFFFPIFLGGLCQQIYGIADALIIGKFLGKEAFAAIDLTTIITRYSTIIFMGFSLSSEIIIAKFYGARDYEKVKLTINNIIGIAIIMAIVTTPVCLFSCENILNFTDVPLNLKSMSYSYLSIIFLGLLFVYIYNVGFAILRALGESRNPLYFLLLSTSLNIFLDFIFISKLTLGVKSVAFATIISQCIASFLVLYNIKIIGDKLNKKFIRVKLLTEHTKEILKKGTHLIIYDSTYLIANTLIQKTINSFGSNLIAAWGLTGKIDSIFFIFFSSLSSSFVTFISQNNGAKKYNRISSAFKLCIFTVILATIPIEIFLYINYIKISMLLINDLKIANLALYIFYFFLPLYTFYGLGEMFMAYLKGIGKTFDVMIVNLFTILLPRILYILFLLPKYKNEFTLFLIFPMSWILFFALSLSIYLKNRNLNKLENRSV